MIIKSHNTLTTSEESYCGKHIVLWSEFKSWREFENKGHERRKILINLIVSMKIFRLRWKMSYINFKKKNSKSSRNINTVNNQWWLCSDWRKFTNYYICNFFKHVCVCEPAQINEPTHMCIRWKRDEIKIKQIQDNRTTY